MNVYDNKTYMEDIGYYMSLNLPWEKLRNKSILISGATGLIGSFFIDVIMEKNMKSDLNCQILALTRNTKKAAERFSKYVDNNNLIFINYDVSQEFKNNEVNKIDYVIHLASNTHPIQYATDPIGTITTNIIGLKNMLDFALLHKAQRFVFASSNEIYGENRGDVEFFDENYCGYINSNTLRAGYPESKRCGEALCQAYLAQNNLDFVIARFTRTYGPTMRMDDSKAISQFIKKGVYKEDIELKSAGNQLYSYQYVGDSVSGLLTIMLNGACGEAYNIAKENSDISLKDLASYIAESADRKVIFAVPDETEAAGYSKATKARLCGKKLSDLGWQPKYDIKKGVVRTIAILQSLNNIE